MTRPVLVQGQVDGELIVLSSTPAVIDDELTLDVAGGDRTASLSVTVAGSRPVAVDGGIRYELRLRPVEPI